ncbi:glycosyltransferase family 2 protein [Ligilactobacillus salivarius]|uniref:glycosyltransferase family 2 protein n=1 Tax=Ligilactobacillus salivarius TaxID=1624 RepID=UPI00210764C1|nr:glycosyltransferase [Ligilactobacillus salivarius]MDM8262302.1 glycosyltransferase [Ligilactobacillus salivarius]
MYKFSFVVLHYKSYKDTIECVNSILDLYSEVNVVIVDNASGDGTVEKLIKKYKSKENIYIIKNNRNLGFAEGNNVGYTYAREVLLSEFILVCNNDLIFSQEDYLVKIKKIYNETGAYIIGPDIESLSDGQHQNPMSPTTTNPYRINREILRYKLLLFLSKLNVYDFLKKNDFHNIQLQQNRIVHNELKENEVLHGSMLIFTPRYVKKEENAFRLGTFLYMEEDILYAYARSKNYKTLYAPNLHVYHKEDSSTNKQYRTSKEKREFIFRNMIKSLKVYKKYIIGLNKV